MKSIHSFDSFLSERAKSANESMSSSDKDKIKEIMKSNKFFDLRKPLTDAGFKVDFTFEPVATYIVSKGRNKVAILNKRYAEDYEFEHDGIVMGDMNESVHQGSTNETFANGMQDHKPKQGKPSAEQIQARAKKFAEAVKLVRQALESLESCPKLDYTEDIPYYIGKLKELLSTDGGEAGLEQLLGIYQREAVEANQSGKVKITVVDEPKQRNESVQSVGSVGSIRRPDGPQKAKIVVKNKFGQADEWWLTSIDPTHLFLSNSPDAKGSAYHVGQFRDKPYYHDMAAWLLNQFEIDGKTYQMQ